MHSLLNLLLAVSLINIPCCSQAESVQPTALIYRGLGSCDEGCSEATAEIARKAGLTPVFVGPKEINGEKFQKAKLWVQPGGDSIQVANAMHPMLKQQLLDFVMNGGGYVGFCAGAFFATEKIGSLKISGLGIFPGQTHLFDTLKNNASIIKIDWSGSVRHLYWNGGPRLIFSDRSKVIATAFYPDGTVASATSHFGKGRIYVTGLHPEAPDSWKQYFSLKDYDGADDDIAIRMIRWVANLSTSPI